MGEQHCKRCGAADAEWIFNGDFYCDECYDRRSFEELLEQMGDER